MRRLTVRWLSPLLIIGGVIAFLPRKNSRAGQVGRVALGLGVIILALQLVMLATQPMRNAQGVQVLFASLSGDILLDMLIGVVFTLLSWSSLSVVLLTAALVASGLIAVPVALSLVLGANLGSGLLALLVNLRTPGAGRHVAVGNLFFKLAGCLIFGLALADSIETGARNLTLIGSMLILFGLVLFAAEKVGKRTRPLERIRTRDGLIMGFAQALALVPGVSRSGATISAGLFLGLDRVAAARFSFLLSIPAVVLSGGLQLFSLLLGEGDASGADPGWAAIAVATVLAFFAGYATIAFLLRYLATHSVNVFVVYRIALGTLVLVLVGTGAIA